MNAIQALRPVTTFARGLACLGALLLLTAPSRALSSTGMNSPEAQQGSREGRQQEPRPNQPPRTDPAPRQGEAGNRANSGGRQRGNQSGQRENQAGRQTGQEGRPAPQNNAGGANGRRAANARAQAERAQQQRAQNARNGQGANKSQVRVQQSGARPDGEPGRAANGTRAENARRQKLAADAAEAERVKLAREQAAANGRVLTGEEALEAERIANARQQAGDASALDANGNSAQRVANARAQREARLQAVLELSPAEKAQRIANARRQFAALNPAQDAAARRFMVAQNLHNDRIARMRRIEELLLRSGDEDNLARVRSLRAKQQDLHEADRQRLGQVLSEEQVRAVEETGQIGTRTARGEAK